MEKQYIILENDKENLPASKKVTVHRFLQSIRRMDYHYCNKPIDSKTEYGTQKGFYFTIDLLYHITKNLEISLRGKLYRKLLDCKLAVSVVFPADKGVYMRMFLRSHKSNAVRG